MPLIRTIQIDPGTLLGVWQIAEPADFFEERVQVQASIHHPHKRLQHLAGRYLLTSLFADFPLADIRISNNRKPVLTDGRFHFSISHCGDYAAAIISRHGSVGIDIEEMQPTIEKIAPKFLNRAERAFIDPLRALAHKTICWSAKEAVYKWYGHGGIDFKEHIRLQPFPCRPAGLIHCHFHKGGDQAVLQLQYLLEDKLCLAWTLAADAVPAGAK
ncbi:MAG TPA: 4'-phosphopantetheinyl transferase superfamily protein [Chitinophaga sp.]